MIDDAFAPSLLPSFTSCGPNIKPPINAIVILGELMNFIVVSYENFNILMEI